MEICQLKKSQGSMDDEENYSSFYETFQTPEHYDITDRLIQHLLSQNVAPFTINQSVEIRRETDLVEAQTQNIKDKILNYCRKEKSLSELSRKFINNFEGTGRTQIVLDQVTTQLNVQRRRIYDIINIMESLGVVSKQRKNVYIWKGLSEAINTIQNYSQGKQFRKIDKTRKQKSLQSLATEFLKLFINHPTNFTLDEAADSIMRQGSDSEGRKTKVRRLYDIVNVFKCLNLIEKVANTGQKSGFKWRGCSDLLDFIERKKDLGSPYQTELFSESSQKFYDSEKKAEKENIQICKDIKITTEPRPDKKMSSKTLKSETKSVNNINYYSDSYTGQMSFFQNMVKNMNISNLTSKDLHEKFTELMWPKETFS